ncbi:TetR family transcriptional regulator [Nocardia nova]|uniref:TetR family transcriptional regulator n=1 Tax=Nocardia nova TaxID=37330 RepID=A0A2S6AVH2_9NOCA|nr:TetR/AcrR family transcriptional regulator [Nocardia nova]PPJ33486.1 TetR family transcriptional regulator [Nocardia nova]PPJ39277.1 TetR family transcriptional regulator [Nocardia nova]
MSTSIATTEDRDPVIGAAVDRALSKRRADVQREVEAILDAALRVAERVAPNPPRVADIVAEAGTSNQAFYKFFSSKDELMRAVLARGTGRVHTYLSHRIGKTDKPAEQVEEWIRGVLAQVGDQTAARQSRAITIHLGDRAIAEAGAPGLDKARELLRKAVRAMGSEHVELDTNAVFELTFAVLARHSAAGSSPSAEESAHLVEFCLAAVAHGRTDTAASMLSSAGPACGAAKMKAP